MLLPWEVNASEDCRAVMRDVLRWDYKNMAPLLKQQRQSISQTAVGAVVRICSSCFVSWAKVSETCGFDGSCLTIKPLRKSCTLALGLRHCLLPCVSVLGACDEAAAEWCIRNRMIYFRCFMHPGRCIHVSLRWLFPSRRMVLVTTGRGRCSSQSVPGVRRA